MIVTTNVAIQILGLRKRITEIGKKQTGEQF